MLDPAIATTIAATAAKIAEKFILVLNLVLRLVIELASKFRMIDQCGGPSFIYTQNLPVYQTGVCCCGSIYDAAVQVLALLSHVCNVKLFSANTTLRQLYL